MYFLSPLNKLVCAATKNTFPMCKLNKRSTDKFINIWRIPFKQTSETFLEDIHARFSCEETFIACFWICLLTALVGFGEAISEFVRVYSDDEYEPTTFYSRNYQNIPLDYQRKSRLFGSTLNIAINLFLLYGFLNFRYVYLYPWIICNAFIIALESFYWISNVIRNKIFKWKPFFSIMFLLCRLLLVIHVSMLISKLEID